LDVQRVPPGADINTVAAEQAQAILTRLPRHHDPVPLFVFDGGYDAVRLALALADTRGQLLVRIRSDRCFYAAPPPAAAARVGRPRRHGAKFTCADATTWPPSSATLSLTDPQYGSVLVQAGNGPHAKTRQHDGHGNRGPRPIVPGTVIRLRVSALPGRTRAPKTLWLWWHSPTDTPPDLDLLWRAYIRRFDIEHTFRLCEQTLNRTLPRPRTAAGSHRCQPRQPGAQPVEHLPMAQPGEQRRGQQQVHRDPRRYQPDPALQRTRLRQHLIDHLERDDPSQFTDMPRREHPGRSDCGNLFQQRRSCGEDVLE
jgi:hypothetical protein